MVGCSHSNQYIFNIYAVVHNHMVYYHLSVLGNQATINIYAPWHIIVFLVLGNQATINRYEPWPIIVLLGLLH